MDRLLEHLLLIGALAEQRGCQLAGVGAALNGAAFCLQLEEFFWRDVYRHPFTEVHLSGASCPILPMLCPQCSHSDHRATSTNSKLDDQIVRRRVCQSCGHVWFTVEVIVPSYAVGWSKGHLRKPVLRVPLELQAAHTRMRVGHVEAKDQLAGLQEANERRSDEADERYGM